jgi:hypothetical protein
MPEFELYSSTSYVLYIIFITNIILQLELALSFNKYKYWILASMLVVLATAVFFLIKGAEKNVRTPHRFS